MLRTLKLIIVQNVELKHVNMDSEKELSLIYAKKKYRNEHKKSSESGFIFCENCNGYYELQPGEYKENFDNCDCGGKLKFVETIEAVFDEDLNLEEKICPVCGICNIK